MSGPGGPIAIVACPVSVEFSVLEETALGFNEDMELLRVKLRQLEAEYEQWFSGASPKQPSDTRKLVDDLIKKYGRSPPHTTAEKSVFQMYQAKFNSCSEMWARRIRLKEEGKLPQEERPRRGQATGPAASRAAGGPRDSVREVFDAFVAARQKAGQPVGNLSYDSFRRQLEQKAQQYRAQYGHDVDFGVSTKDGKVSLVARRKK